jgi:hypothetical protein
LSAQHCPATQLDSQQTLPALQSEEASQEQLSVHCPPRQQNWFPPQSVSASQHGPQTPWAQQLPRPHSASEQQAAVVHTPEQQS